MNRPATDTLVIEPTINMAMLGGTVSPMIAADGEHRRALGCAVTLAQLRRA